MATQVGESADAGALLHDGCSKKYFVFNNLEGGQQTSLNFGYSTICFVCKRRLKDKAPTRRPGHSLHKGPLAQDFSPCTYGLVSMCGMPLCPKGLLRTRRLCLGNFNRKEGSSYE
eukprot:1979723-Amphidinium_carterae.1